MKLYMHPLSPNVRRVRVTAAILGIPLDEQQLDLGTGEHKAPAYLALNPNGAVPTLVDDDLVLTESRAIMQHLADKKPETGLFPRDAPARADVVRWQFWDASHFSPPLGTLVFEKMIKGLRGMGAPDQRKVDDAMGAFRRFAAVLDQRLATREVVVGDALTIADLTMACSAMYATQTGVPLGDFTHVAAWLGRIAALDAWKATEPS